jgi:hypothetical protein
MWKRSNGRATKAPSDERGGNRHARPTAIAPHPDSTQTIPRSLSSRPLPPEADGGVSIQGLWSRFPFTEQDGRLLADPLLTFDWFKPLQRQTLDARSTAHLPRSSRGTIGYKRDPYARELLNARGADHFPRCFNVIRASGSCPWHDAGFTTPDFSDMVIYPAHIGVYADRLGVHDRDRLCDSGNAARHGVTLLRRILPGRPSGAVEASRPRRAPVRIIALHPSERRRVMAVANNASDANGHGANCWSRSSQSREASPCKLCRPAQDHVGDRLSASARLLPGRAADSRLVPLSLEARHQV